MRAVKVPTSGFKYRYVHYKPAKGKPYILWLHGFPSSSYDWRRQFDYFHKRGYGSIAPDTLGFGGTDKPSEADLSAYTMKNMARDIVEILDCEGIKTFVGAGHDL